MKKLFKSTSSVVFLFLAVALVFLTAAGIVDANDFIDLAKRVFPSN